MKTRLWRADIGGHRVVRQSALRGLARSVQLRGLRMPLTRIAIGLALLASGCATGSACRRDPITGQDHCQSASGSPVEAVGTAAAAGVAWGVAGCTVNDCEPPFRCNRDTKLCERIRCSEGRNSCPPAYHCDPVDQVCR